MRFNFSGSELVRILKWLAMIIPALATAYASIATIAGLPYGSEVVEISAVIVTLIMAVVGFASPDIRIGNEETPVGDLEHDEEASE